MIRQPTTLILGAGSSVPYGYPTGTQLVEQIILLARKARIAGGFIDMPFGRIDLSGGFSDSYRQIEEFCERVRKLNPVSIDSFLRDNPKIENIGRRVISYIIMTAEYNDRGSISIHDKDNKNAGFKGWYQLIFDALVSHCATPEELHELHGLNVVTFNYDVSLEYFLAKALLENERTQPYAKEIFESIKIVHIYGKVGNICIANGKVGYDYGKYKKNEGISQEINEDAWVKSENCKLHVAIENKNKTKEVLASAEVAKKFMENSDRLLCMGFDFHRDNCDLIDMNESYWPPRKLFYLNYAKNSMLDNRVKLWTKSRGRIIRLKSKSCYEALTTEYDLTS